jgi:hypothetical protein
VIELKPALRFSPKIVSPFCEAFDHFFTFLLFIVISIEQKSFIWRGKQKGLKEVGIRLDVVAAVVCTPLMLLLKMIVIQR